MLVRLPTLASLLLFASCGSNSSVRAEQPISYPVEDSVPNQSESDRLQNFFAEDFAWRLRQSPELQTQLGKKTDYGKWDDISEEHAAKRLAHWKTELVKLQQSFDFDKLNAQEKISYRLFEFDYKRKIEGHSWRLYDYPVNQMHGKQAEIPAFLINYHKINSVSDAEAYIERLLGVQPLLAQLEVGLKQRQELGILPPLFVFAHVLRDSENLIKGKPFDSGEDSTLLGDFRKKVSSLSISDKEKTVLMVQAESALIESVQPAYQSLLTVLKEMQENATKDDGVWKLPKGGEYYSYALREMTTTNMSAEQVHALGLQEVERIHSEMREIMKVTKFQGNLPNFFHFMRTDKQFYLPNTDEGRKMYLAQAAEIIDQMRLKLDSLFITKPKAGIVVKRVEAFREQSAGKAFYSGPSPDGTRPGTYYANLYRMERMPTYQMEALAFHEGIPGHHMQVAIATELESVPEFRKHGGYTAYGEGWGLYSEYLAKEVGFYKDPYSDFGRLAMELWRACRLVVDTGIHDKKWSREQAIDYLTKNTPNPQGDVVNAIERYIVMPGQATAYKIGMIEILRLRNDAKVRLGQKFDIREFHEVIVANGPVPLAILAELVDTWVNKKLTN